MNSVLIAALFFTPLVSALAADRSVSFTCEGRELRAGNAGRTGKFEINASTSDDVVGGHWDITADWLDGSVLNPGSICGMEIPSEYECTSYSPSRALEENGKPVAFSLRTYCNDPKERRAPPRKTVTATFVLDSSRTHGRYSCSSSKGRNSGAIELTNCEAN